jgi:hypothetical protein
MSLVDFVVSPPDCGRSVADFWGWDAHEAQLRCPDEVDGDIWIRGDRRGLNLNYTKLPRPWSPWGTSPSSKNLHGRTGNRTRDLMIISQKLWPLDHETGRNDTSSVTIFSIVLSTSWLSCFNGYSVAVSSVYVGSVFVTRFLCAFAKFLKASFNIDNESVISYYWLFTIIVFYPYFRMLPFRISVL